MHAHPSGAGAYGVSALGPFESGPGPMSGSCRRRGGRGLSEVRTPEILTARAEILAPA